MFTRLVKKQPPPNIKYSHWLCITPGYSLNLSHLPADCVRSLCNANVGCNTQSYTFINYKFWLQITILFSALYNQRSQQHEHKESMTYWQITYSLPFFGSFSSIHRQQTWVLDKKFSKFFPKFGILDKCRCQIFTTLNDHREKTVVES